LKVVQLTIDVKKSTVEHLLLFKSEALFGRSSKKCNPFMSWHKTIEYFLMATANANAALQVFQSKPTV